MMTVKEIEYAITKLPPAEVAELAVWIEEFESRVIGLNDPEAATLTEEMNRWEIASDEDLLNFEKKLVEIG